MTRFRVLRRWFTDERGNAAIEFAIVGPTLIAMLLGVLWVGLQMQKYNALRSIAADVNRYTVVEYQKDDKLTSDQIESVAAAIAVKAPYNLTGSQFDATVTAQSSPVAGATDFYMVLDYTPDNFLSYFGISAITMTYTQNIYVPS